MIRAHCSHWCCNKPEVFNSHPNRNHCGSRRSISETMRSDGEAADQPMIISGEFLSMEACDWLQADTLPFPSEHKDALTYEARDVCRLCTAASRWNWPSNTIIWDLVDFYPHLVLQTYQTCKCGNSHWLAFCQNAEKRVCFRWELKIHWN